MAEKSTIVEGSPKKLSDFSEKNKESSEKNKESSEKHDNKKDKKTSEPKKESEKEPKKKPKKVPKKDFAEARGVGLHFSMKVGSYICRFIKGKNVDEAIKDLEDVIKMRRAIPYKGEIPHRKGKGMMSGRYPVKACGLFIKTLKGLKGNVIVNGMDFDKSAITLASASWATRPARQGGKQAKRTNIYIRVEEVKEKKKNG